MVQSYFVPCVNSAVVKIHDDLLLNESAENLLRFQIRSIGRGGRRACVYHAV